MRRPPWRTLAARSDERHDAAYEKDYRRNCFPRGSRIMRWGDGFNRCRLVERLVRRWGIKQLLRRFVRRRGFEQLLQRLVWQRRHMQSVVSQQRLRALQRRDLALWQHTLSSMPKQRGAGSRVQYGNDSVRRVRRCGGCQLPTTV